jgi:hypothetical protein
VEEAGSLVVVPVEAEVEGVLQVPAQVVEPLLVVVPRLGALEALLEAAQTLAWSCPVEAQPTAG